MVLEFEATPVKPAEDTVIASLFTTSSAPPSPPRQHAKGHWSRESEEARARKKEHTDLKAARRAYLNK